MRKSASRAEIHERPQPDDLPPIGSMWTKTAWTDRTVIGHRYNEWGRCWWVKVQHGQGTMEIPLSKWRKWADGAKRNPAMCTPECMPEDHMTTREEEGAER